MSAELKRILSVNSSAHVREFGKCEGVVLGPVDYGNQKGPEVDVRWEPSGLKYMYLPEHLEEAR